ncbi:hypothetical protein D3C87_1973670 [compost metagenome]
MQGNIQQIFVLLICCELGKQVPGNRQMQPLPCFFVQKLVESLLQAVMLEAKAEGEPG